MDASHQDSPARESLERQIDVWRGHLRSSQTVTDADAAELEDHLREQIDALVNGGLTPDEAFLVAVKRMGALDELTREFAREHSERLWKQLFMGVAMGPGEASAPFGTTRMWVALGLAVLAAAAFKIPTFFGIPMDPDAHFFYPLNFAFFTLPFIAAYFAWERPLDGRGKALIAGGFVLAAAAVNGFPFPAMGEGGEVADTLVLAVLHLPIALWFLVGVAYVGGRWRGSGKRMDFLRFTGEVFVYYVLIGLGGGVLIGTTLALFQAIGLNAEGVVQDWIFPSGIVGATVIASWLVEAKQSVIENIAPVLARIFVPLFALVLLAFVVTMAGTGRGLDVEREVLITVDLLLVVVFGLLLYSISARDPLAAPGAMDWIQLALVGSALLVDVLALWAIGSRISEFGFTPNRTAALGMNLVLLLNLAGSAVLYLRFLRGGGAVTRLWEWQMTYVYVLAGWGAVVAFLFPVVFGFA